MPKVDLMPPDPIGPSSGRSVNFLDLDFATADFAWVVAWLRSRGAASDFAYLVTPNVDHIVRLANAPGEVRAAYRAADLLVCDSRVLARLARMSGVVLPVVPGSDLVAALFAGVLQAGDRVCLIGGTAETAARLRALYPALDLRHHDAPPRLRTDPAARAQAVRFAIDAAARVILIAVGSPQQELIAHEMALDGRARGTALCIGAAVDFISGAQTRAPVRVQRAGMEWAWRLARNPRRLARRYLIEGPAVFALVWRWRRRNRQA